PEFLSNITYPDLRSWARDLHTLWKSLGRKVRAEVQDRPELYSLIYTPHPLIVPGGRFRELYYWDSYWVINGLLLSEMKDTARGMISNFLYLVERYGFVPNGARVYYERRSQPPFLTLMVESYYQATQDKSFLSFALPLLEKEYQFWMENRSVLLVINVLFKLHYLTVAPSLPPESYTDDLELAQGLSKDAQERLWAELKAGAESGWDFTSRWYMAEGGRGSGGTLSDTRTSHILPVDLNALLCRNERTLAFFYKELGNTSAAQYWEDALQQRMAAVQAVLWDEETGVWRDYSLLSNTSRPGFYPSNLAPLWAQCYAEPGAGERALEYLQASGALKYPNGVPTSLSDSGQQWDYPNAWPPLQHMIIEGLSKLSSESAQQIALDLSQKWIQTNRKAYKTYQAMFEKVNLSLSLSLSLSASP
ncbi:TREA Trehalase, partial [Amia calva]|nr:TREA Trehalase [Amia calva]